MEVTDRRAICGVKRTLIPLTDLMMDYGVQCSIDGWKPLVVILVVRHPRKDKKMAHVCHAIYASVCLCLRLTLLFDEDRNNREYEVNQELDKDFPVCCLFFPELELK